MLNERMKVIIADNSKDLCDLLQKELRRFENLEVVGSAQDGLTLLKLIRQWEPDILIVTHCFPKRTASPLCAHCRRQSSGRNRRCFCFPFSPAMP